PLKAQQFEEEKNGFQLVKPGIKLNCLVKLYGQTPNERDDWLRKFAMVKSGKIVQVDESEEGEKEVCNSKSNSQYHSPPKVALQPEQILQARKKEDRASLQPTEKPKGSDLEIIGELLERKNIIQTQLDGAKQQKNSKLKKNLKMDLNAVEKELQ